MTCYDCPEHRRFTRRQLLGGAIGAGAGSFLGLLRPEILFAQPSGKRKADSVILLWMGGGMSHIDTLDPKPGVATGGPFEAIATSAKDIRISEKLPLLAKDFNDISLIRSLTSKEGSHERATYLMHTGYMPLSSFQHSTLGSVTWRSLGAKNPDLPAYITIGRETWPAGFLGSSFAPFQIENPDRPAQNLEYHRSVDDKHFQSRLKLLNEFDKKFAAEHRGADVIEAYANHYKAAYKLMKSKSVAAFDLSGEAQAIRERYGLTFFGQGCLLSRRLVQAGVRFVEVSFGGWDTHQDNFERVTELSAALDQGVSALLSDLRRLDMLDRTLVLLCSEFGRTPTINGNQGRDHWPRAWSALLAGGGIVGGKVIGSTDATGSEPAERPVQIGELHATVCKSLGIDPTAQNYAPDGRPIRVVQDVNLHPIDALFA